MGLLSFAILFFCSYKGPLMRLQLLNYFCIYWKMVLWGFTRSWQLQLVFFFLPDSRDIMAYDRFFYFLFFCALQWDIPCVAAPSMFFFLPFFLFQEFNATSCIESAATGETCSWRQNNDASSFPITHHSSLAVRALGCRSNYPGSTRATMATFRWGQNAKGLHI